MNLLTLMQEKIVRIASLPPANWQEVDTSVPLTVPLIAEDYPAKTAVMWNTAYRQFGLPDRNTMMVADPKDLPKITEAFRADPRYRGGGAGVGFKEAVIPYLDSVTPLAHAMGAVNIVKKDGDRLIGDNTDGLGYARGLESVLAAVGISLKGSHVLILGAGGSGRAIAFALAQAGAKLTILNRTEAKSRELADALNHHFGDGVAVGGGREQLPSAIGEADALVSVIDDAVSPLDAYSTIGDMELPVTLEAVARNRDSAERLLKAAKPALVVSDIRIRKGPTQMLSQAEALGFRTLDGIPMVINQGVAAFWWLYGEVLEAKGISQGDIAQVMRAAAQN